MDDDSVELLFFDTFSHATANDGTGNMDLVQFPQPVEVSEVRVIPLGCRVQADFPGGHPRLGATNPSEFQLEFFVNDLSRRNASTFVQLGELDFGRDEIRFCPSRVPTDGLLIKGRYNTITLAVYGNTTTLEAELTPPPAQQQATAPIRNDHGGHHPSHRHHHPSHAPVEVPLEWSAEADTPPVDVRQQHHHYKEILNKSPEKKELRKDILVVARDEPIVKENSKVDERFTPPGAKKRRRPQTPPMPPIESSRKSPSPPIRSNRSEISSRHDRPDSRTRRDRDEQFRRRSGSFERDDKVQSKQSVISMKKSRDKERERRPLSPPKKIERSWSESPRSAPEDELEEISSEDELLDPTNLRAEESPSESPSAVSPDVREFIFDVRQQLLEEVMCPSFLAEKSYLPQGLDADKMSELVQRVENEGELLKGEKFVLAMEDAASLFGENSKFETLATDVQFALVDWCRDGLDFDLAMQQTQPAFKVRHLKAGLRLTVAIMGSCGEDTVKEFLRTSTAGFHFMELLLKPHMTLPLKLHLVRCLDMLSHFQCGIHYLLFSNFKLAFDSTEKIENHTCYQSIVKFVLARPTARLCQALSALMRRLHLCESCAALRSTTIDLIKSAPGMEPSLEEATTMIKEVLITHQEARSILAQYVRNLPARNKLDTPKPAVNPYIGLYAMYRYSRLIESCSVLSARSKKFQRTFELFLKEIMKDIEGCVYLLRTPASLKLLEKLFPSVSATLRSICLISIVFENTPKDSLDEFQGGADQNEMLVQALHRLACFTLERSEPRFAQGLVHALTLNDNLKCILQFLQKKNGQLVIKSSVCYGYSVILLKTVIQTAVLSNEFLEKYLSTLVELSENSTKLESIAPWLEPVLNLQYPLDSNCVASLVESVKNYVEDNALLCPQIITAVQTLRTVCGCPDVTKEFITLKDRYILRELYAQDGLAVMCELLEKLCEHFCDPLVIKLEFSSKMKVTRVLQVTTPALEMVCLILKLVIGSQEADFNDLTPIPILLNVYQLLWCLGQYQLSVLVVDTLLAYTQPIRYGNETEQVLNKSLWTQMLKAVVCNIRHGPKCFGVTLQILCEFLPLPLPMKVGRQFEEKDAVVLINKRKLWTVYLYQCQEELLELYQCLGTSADLNVIRLLETLTIQMCDLSAPCCQMVLNIVSQSIANFPKEIDQQYLQGYLSILSNLCDNHLASALGVLALYANSESPCNPLQLAVSLLGETSSDDVAWSCIRFIQSVLMKATKYSQKSLTAALLKVILSHAGSEKCRPAAILEAIRCVVTLKSEATVPHITEIIEDNIILVYKVSAQLASKFSPDSQDCVSALFSLVELLKKLSENALNQLIAMEERSKHPLTLLKLKLQASSVEEFADTFDVLETFLETHQNNDIANADVESTPALEPFPAEVHPQLSFSEVYGIERTVYVYEEVSDDESTDSSPMFNTPADLDDYESDCAIVKDEALVEIDLVDISEMCTMSELSLRAELEKLLSRIIKQEMSLFLPKHHRTQSVSEEVKKPFVAPMRASVAPVMTRQSRANDPFRSRPPNTSRPPSMHVDDFVAMESSSRGIHRQERTRSRGSRTNWPSGSQRHF
ncbi:protein virilizer homolog [Galendromus occidentalis]|uniref:Protein virilizer homolog n=1 Tax=Galendromus occidentalis TaxID=34638 RepID=A0AAJ7SHR4_9ACAR|nr:protein virilizer homolog [Galendromus occidentalis]